MNQEFRDQNGKFITHYVLEDIYWTEGDKIEPWMEDFVKPSLCAYHGYQEGMRIFRKCKMSKKEADAYWQAQIE